MVTECQPKEDQKEVPTYTKDMREATRAETPATIVIARARLEPVPPVAVILMPQTR